MNLAASWFSLLLLAGMACRATAADAPPREPVDYMIVVTGNELLEGVYADGHTHFLTRTLRPLGMRCVGSMSVDDRPASLKEALRFAAGKASLVIVTGGLGPTDNDITRETIAQFTGIPLAEHADVLAAMTRRFGVSAEELRKNMRRQTLVPKRGTYLKNANGTSVGLVFEQKEAIIVALPGPPRELQPMVRDGLIPYLSRRVGTRLPGCSMTLRFVGLGQSQIDQTLEDHVPLPADVTLSSQFNGSRVDFTFSLPDDTPEDRARLQQLKQSISTHLGESIYGEGRETLEQRVMTLLAERSETLTLVEVGTGGSLAAGLTEPEVARRVLRGAHVAATDEAMRSLLRVPDEKWTQRTSHADRAKLLATTAAERTESDWAVAVGEPWTNRAGRRQIEVAVRSPDGRVEGRAFEFRGTGQVARFRLITQLLDQFRRRLR